MRNFCAQPSLFSSQKKTVKLSQHLLGSNTFWCWKAVFNHCKVGKVAKNRKEQSAACFNNNQNNLSSLKEAKRRESKPERRKFQQSVPQTGLPKDGHQGLECPGERRVLVKSALGKGICQHRESWSFFYNPASPLKCGFLQLRGIMQAPCMHGEEKVVGNNVSSHIGEGRARSSTAAGVSGGDGGVGSCIVCQGRELCACQPMEPNWLQLWLEPVWYHFLNNHKWDVFFFCYSLELPLQIIRNCSGSWLQKYTGGMWAECFSQPGTRARLTWQHNSAHSMLGILIRTAGDTQSLWRALWCPRAPSLHGLCISELTSVTQSMSYCHAPLHSRPVPGCHLGTRAAVASVKVSFLCLWIRDSRMSQQTDQSGLKTEECILTHK